MSSVFPHAWRAHAQPASVAQRVALTVVRVLPSFLPCGVRPCVCASVRPCARASVHSCVHPCVRLCVCASPLPRALFPRSADAADAGRPPLLCRCAPALALLSQGRVPRQGAAREQGVRPGARVRASRCSSYATLRRRAWSIQCARTWHPPRAGGCAWFADVETMVRVGRASVRGPDACDDARWSTEQGKEAAPAEPVKKKEGEWSDEEEEEEDEDEKTRIQKLRQEKEELKKRLSGTALKS